MSDRIISATEARNKWFEILNIVYFGGEEVIIEKNNTPIVKLIPMVKPGLDSAEEIIEKTFGFLKTTDNYWFSEDKKVRTKEIKYSDRIWKQ